MDMSKLTKSLVSLMLVNLQQRASTWKDGGEEGS